MSPSSFDTEVHFGDNTEIMNNERTTFTCNAVFVECGIVTYT